jgi:DNA-binding transcriptional regulator GbsR (MarR family)
VPPRRSAAPESVGAFIERFAGLLYEAGMPRMPARVFTALLAADAGALTAADLGTALGVSPAAVSGAVRYLAQVGLVATTGERGSRRLSYSVPADVWGQLAEARNANMARLSATLLDGAALLGAQTPAGERLAGSARYFDFMVAEMAEADKRWREFAAGRGGSINSEARPSGPGGTSPNGAGTGRPA